MKLCSQWFWIGLIAGMAQVGFAAEPMEIPVWPAEMLPKFENATAENAKAETIVPRGANALDRSVTHVTFPTLTVYLPENSQSGMTAVVICPGGAYSHLAIDKEGHAVARWLNSIGVAGIVLKYRMPRPDLTAGQTPWPIQDGRRAIRLVRSRAEEWKIDVNHIGMMGFSAGGHLASSVATHVEGPASDAKDPVERLSARPDFLILAYPVISLREPVTHESSLRSLLGKEPDPKWVEFYSNELNVTPQAPPTFLVQAQDDRVSVQNSLLFYAALQKAGVPAEMHIFEKGGHGFGLGIPGTETAIWPSLCATWLKNR